MQIFLKVKKSMTVSQLTDKILDIKEVGIQLDPEKNELVLYSVFKEGQIRGILDGEKSLSSYNLSNSEHQIHA